MGAGSLPSCQGREDGQGTQAQGHGLGKRGTGPGPVGVKVKEAGGEAARGLVGSGLKPGSLSRKWRAWGPSLGVNRML